MKLYLAPGACSLADHIALYEAGLAVEQVKVDFPSHKTNRGEDYYSINPKGYVPTLVLDSGETLTENVAILDWIAEQRPQLRPEGALGRTRLIEMLAFISTELHKSFKPFFRGGTDDEKRAAADAIAKRLGYLAERLDGDYLFGDRFTVADAYLFTMLRWVKAFEVPVPLTGPLQAYFDRVQAREKVAAALKDEGLT